MKICLVEMFWVVVNTILTDMKAQSYIKLFKMYLSLKEKKEKCF